MGGVSRLFPFSHHFIPVRWIFRGITTLFTKYEVDCWIRTYVANAAYRLGIGREGGVFMRVLQ